MTKVIITGNVGKFEVKTSVSGKPFIYFSVATELGFGDKKETKWWGCLAPDTRTDLEKFVKVGNKVTVIGEWKKDGLLAVDSVDLILWAKKKEDTTVVDADVSPTPPSTTDEIPF